MASERPIIGFLTDFGLDGAAAICRAVMLSICRDAHVVDISHTVRKYAVRDGAFLLRSALPYFPVGVHVGVVDPGVGTERLPVGLRTQRGDVLIGPDNGLLQPAAEALGGVAEARVLENHDLWLPDPSATFHGRDIFSPVAAHLAAGTSRFGDVGSVVPIADLATLPAPGVRLEDGALVTETTYVDSFGNVRLAGRRDDLSRGIAGLERGEVVRVSVDGGPRLELTFVPSFGHAPAGGHVLYVDSNGDLAMAINQGDLAATYGLSSGVRIRLEPA